MRTIFTLILLGILFTSANAQRIATEDFNYTAGQLTTLNTGANVSGGNWVGFSGTGKPLQVVAGNLTYTGYSTSPSGTSGRLVADTSKGSAEDAYYTFDSVKAGTVYFSFLSKITSTDLIIPHDSSSADYFAGLLPGSSTSSYFSRIYIRQGATPNTVNYGIAAAAYTSTPISWVSTDFPINATNLVVFSYQFTSGANNDVAKLWVNPALSNTEPSAQASSVYAAGTEPTNAKRFVIRQNYTSGLKAGTPKHEFDALKVSTSWADALLPLTLMSFDYVVSNSTVSLHWRTANEINVQKFAVEKSLDAVSFSTIGEVAAKNMASVNDYTFADAKMLTSKAFYRLNIIDKDGASKYSAVLAVSGTDAFALSVYPNPATNNVVLSHPASKNASIQIFTLDGKRKSLAPVVANAVQTSVDVTNLSNGLYLLVYTDGSTKQAFKFLKK